MGARVLASVALMSFGRGGGGGVAARSGSGSSRWCSAFWSAVDAGGYGAWWHGVVGLLRFRGLLLGLWAWGRGCQ